MKMTKSLIGAAVAVALGLGTVGAHAAAITSATINNFDFNMAGADGLSQQVNMDIVMGTYQGSANPDPAGVASLDSGIVGFLFGGFGPVAAYTTGPNPEPTGDITGGAVTLDLSSWTAFWNGTEFNQGSAAPAITGVVDNGDNTYDLNAAWESTVVGGPFNGQVGSWSMDLTASVVPIPAAAWLFGSAVLGLVGVARRKRT